MSKKLSTAEDKLRALYALQVIDSKIDRIRIIRGELPLEVQDLEDEIEGLRTRVNKIQDDMADVERGISDRRNQIEESKSLIKKYEEQQSNVRNNREYDSLNKEIEFQGLEIQVAEKRIAEHNSQKVAKQELLDASAAKLQEREADLEVKKSELEEIVSETRAEEEILVAMSNEMKHEIEERLVSAYERIRGASKNGLAVVPIEREASAGSFIKIPPQRQLDVAARKKIIVDEHSGRILVDSELAVEERDRVEQIVETELKKLAK